MSDLILHLAGAFQDADRISMFREPICVHLGATSDIFERGKGEQYGIKK
jgi:hypothetical protein